MTVRKKSTASAAAPSLSGVIREKLLADRLTLPELARKAGIPYRTLRNWVANNRFAADEWPRLGPLLGLPANLHDVGAVATFEVTQPRPNTKTRRRTAAFGELHRRTVVPLARALPNEEERIREAFQALPNGALYVFTSFDRPPYEMTAAPAVRAEFEELITERIKKGAVFLYVRPTETAWKAAVSWGLYRLPQYESISALETEFVSRIQRAAGDESVKKQMEFLTEEMNPFVAYRQKLILTCEKPGAPARAHAEFPTTLDPEDPEKGLVHMPLDSDFAAEAFEFVRRVVVPSRLPADSPIRRYFG